MDFRLCPACSKVFMRAKDSAPIKCIYCGFLFEERRSDKRIRTELALELVTESGSMKAKLKDYSINGLRIFYTGLPMMTDSLLSINIEELNLHGPVRVIWTYKLSSHTAMSGLELLHNNHRRYFRERFKTKKLTT